MYRITMLIALFMGFAIKTLCNDLTIHDWVLIEEAMNLKNKLGNQLWKDWGTGSVPLLYKKRTVDVLIDHPAPPNGYVQYYSRTAKKTIWIRPNVDTVQIQATYDINGINTVVISEPDAGYPPCLWVLKAVHEFFHIYQGFHKPVNPFLQEYRGCNELNFPFEYSLSNVKSIGQIEAKYIYLIITKDKWSANDSVDIKQFQQNWLVIAKTIYRDSLHFFYKQIQEWSEGAARYTEREIARLAASEIYKPLPQFVKDFDSQYKTVFNEYYGQNKIFNPLRFVYSGVMGNVIFYYSGLAKCYLLDRLYPAWKTKYLYATLDNLIIINK